jgi:tRNA G18 (ribose-2'-O)-methylase SpoU
MAEEGPFVHQRHQPPSRLERPRELVLAVPPLRSHVNLARIVRLAGCCGIERLIACGHGRIDVKIARDALQQVRIERHRSLAPVLKELGQQDFRLVGLEQASGSHHLHDYRFPRRVVLVIGHERLGLEDDVLNLLHDVVEIPVYGVPFSYNVVTAAAMALYEYCRQYPQG